jgi:hypothetical protein
MVIECTHFNLSQEDKGCDRRSSFSKLAANRVPGRRQGRSHPTAIATIESLMSQPVA